MPCIKYYLDLVHFQKKKIKSNHIGLMPLMCCICVLYIYLIILRDFDSDGTFLWIFFNQSSCLFTAYLPRDILIFGILKTT